MGNAESRGQELDVDTLELINEEIAGRLSRQVSSGASIDTKAVTLVGYASAAATFLTTRHTQPVLAGFSYAGYAASVVFGVTSYAVRLYQDVPSPKQLFDNYINKSKQETLAALAASRVKAYESNVAKYDKKAQRWTLRLVGLVIGVTAMVLALASAYW